MSVLMLGKMLKETLLLLQLILSIPVKEVPCGMANTLLVTSAPLCGEARIESLWLQAT